MSLSEILKKHGLDLAEDVAATTVKGIFAALPDIAAATENKIDDLLVPVFMVLQPQIMAMVDKIDGEEG